MPRLHPLAAAGALFPAVVAAAMLQWLGFFGTRPLRRGEWIFFGILFLGFAVLPAAGFITRWLRSRVGRTIVTVSAEGLRIEERRLMRTHTIAAFSASEILDVDYGTRGSARFMRATNIVVKTRRGLTTFGEGLADDEIRYLHATIRRALAGGA
jgi:hypothetical protein